MPQTEEEKLIAAVELAESIAIAEARLKRLKAKEGDQGWIALTEKMIVTFRRIAAEEDGRLAEQLLPQAEKIVPLRKVRKKFIESQTLLGRCTERLDSLVTFHDLKEKEMLSEEHSPEELIEHLVDGILSGDPRKVAPRLLAVFEAILTGLVHQELPPVAPGYDLMQINFKP